MTLSDFALGLLFCNAEGELELPHDLPPSIHALASKLDAVAKWELCGLFTGDENGRIEPTSTDPFLHAPATVTQTSSRNYIFNLLDVGKRGEYAGLIADMGPSKLPPFLNISIPRWSGDLIADQVASYEKHVRALRAAEGKQFSNRNRGVGDGGEGEDFFGNGNTDESSWGIDVDVEEDGSQHTTTTTTTASSGVFNYSGHATNRSMEVAYDPLISSYPETPAPQFYLGGPGSGAPMHYHEDATNLLIYGKKQWYLHPPALAEYSTISIADYVRYILPGLKGAARPLQCTQQAGDLMFVPHGWGHAILNVETSVGYALEFSTPFQRY